MIFQPELVKQILAGRKTMTRRPVKDGETSCRYRPGRVYAVQQGRGKAATTRITILGEPRQERLGDISLDDARREGFRTREEFREYWAGLYGSHDPERLVWVLSFAKGDCTDRPHLLAARPGGPEGDYTSIPARAVRGEGEAVERRLLEREAQKSRERHGGVVAAERERLLAAVGAVRLEAARQNAGSAMVRKRLKSIEHQLRAMEREARRSA